MVARSRGSLVAGLTGVATNRCKGEDSVTGAGHLSHKAMGVVRCVCGGLDRPSGRAIKKEPATLPPASWVSASVNDSGKFQNSSPSSHLCLYRGNLVKSF